MCTVCYRVSVKTCQVNVHVAIDNFLATRKHESPRELSFSSKKFTFVRNSIYIVYIVYIVNIYYIILRYTDRDILHSNRYLRIYSGISTKCEHPRYLITIITYYIFMIDNI